MNTQLVESIFQVIMSLSPDEKDLLKQKLLFDSSSPSTHDLMELAQNSGSFNFLHDEPDLYTIEDGELIS